MKISCGRIGLGEFDYHVGSVEVPLVGTTDPRHHPVSARCGLSLDGLPHFSVA